jgi:hypothetical protein
MKHVRVFLSAVVITVVLAVVVSNAWASLPISYAWAYQPNTNIGIEGKLKVLAQESGYQWVGAQIGLCRTGNPPCGTEFIETGYARGGLTDGAYQQYVRYNDGSTDTMWVEKVNLTVNNIYYMRLWYDSSTSEWKVYRASCSNYTTCDPLGNPIKTISGSTVGFSQGASIYAGAGGQGTLPPLTLAAEDRYLKYHDRISWYDFGNWWTPGRCVRSSTVFGITAYGQSGQVYVDMSGGAYCP